MPTAIAARPHAAYAATVASTHVTKSCKPSAVPLSNAQMTLTTAGNPTDAFCYTIAICTGFWPIGTLMCGMTAIGCVIYYAKQ